MAAAAAVDDAFEAEAAETIGRSAMALAAIAAAGSAAEPAAGSMVLPTGCSATVATGSAMDAAGS